MKIKYSNLNWKIKTRDKEAKLGEEIGVLSLSISHLKILRLQRNRDLLLYLRGFFFSHLSFTFLISHFSFLTPHFSAFYGSFHFQCRSSRRCLLWRSHRQALRRSLPGQDAPRRFASYRQSHKIATVEQSFELRVLHLQFNMEEFESELAPCWNQALLLSLLLRRYNASCSAPFLLHIFTRPVRLSL